MSRDPNVRLDYLPQLPDFDPANTVLEQVFAGLSDEARAVAEYEAKTILTRLGVPMFDQPVGQLSGGQRKRVALCAALVSGCDVLILDEPTNHLDSGMVAWLEDYLRAFKGALVMVTHDRYFLERVTQRLVEVERGKLYFYEGNYDKYLERKAQREEMAQASERKRQSILRRELQWVMQGPTARGTKSRERLERYEALKEQKGPEEKAAMEITALSSRLGKKIIEIEQISKSFDGKVLVKDFSYNLLRGDRVGIIGPNGYGKTTLVRMICGLLEPDQGRIVRGETVRIGYFSQESFAGEDFDPTVKAIDYIRHISQEIQTPEGTLTAAQMMEKFLFPADLQYTEIGRLSGGERRRLYLLRVLMEAPNVLVLDEPTNDLDIETLAVLEDYLEQFPGVVIAVSHDRYFLDKLMNHVFVLAGNGEVRHYTGGYADYRADVAEQQRLAAQERLDSQPLPNSSLKKTSGGRSHQEKLKFSFKEQREYEEIDGVIAGLEEKIAQTEALIAQNASDYAALQELTAEKEELETQLAAKMERWVYLNDLAERIEAQGK